MKKLRIIDDPFDPAPREFEGDDVIELIKRELPQWPATARIYHEQVAKSQDVTPFDDASYEVLGKLDGTIIVVINPGWETILVNLIIAAILTAATYFLTPKLSAPTLPQPAERKIDSASPNNALSNRTNQARPNGRIPDIFGTVRATPDLLAVPFTKFIDNVEYEHAYMCLGRGSYDVDEIKDGDTLVEDIDGVSVEVYGPNKSPNSGHAPDVRIGTAIGIDIANIGKCSAVVGQDLLVSNSGRLTRSGNFIRFHTPNQIKIKPFDDDGDPLDFTDYFTDGDNIQLSNTSWDNSAIRSVTGFPATISGTTITRTNTTDFTEHFVVGRNLTLSGTSGVFNLDGTYVISAVTTSTVSLTNPAAVNSNWNSIPTGSQDYDSINLSTPLVTIDLDGTYTATSVSAANITLDSPTLVTTDWNKLAFLPGGLTDYLSSSLTPSFDRHIGPFVIADTEADRFIINIVAEGGLYKDNGTKQQAINATLDIKFQRLNAAGSPVGSEQVFSVVVYGSAVSRQSIGMTFELAPDGGAARYRVRIKRTDNFDYGYVGTTVDGLKWRDCFSSSRVTQDDFGNVTTVQALTKATNRALSVKERKLTMLASRKIATRSGDHFTTVLTASNDIADILCAMALDPYIGRRTIDELDLDNIYDTQDDVVSYFGSTQFKKFNYTFDKAELSFEEQFQMVAQAAFCAGYRRGKKLKITFEKATSTSTLLFNHRNKVPKSEVRTYRFGNVKDFDGIEYTYVDPEDETIATYYIPTDRSALAPRKIESVGIRHVKQAYVHAWREYNKMRFQNCATRFDALQEAELTLPNDRIQVADNTRQDTMDGEVISQNGFILELSQQVTLDGGTDYTIFLQLPDGTVESFGAIQGVDAWHVVIDGTPSLPLSLDAENAARSVFMIVDDDDPRVQAFLITERDAPTDKFVYPLTAINYDARYYSRDLTYPT